VQESGRIGEMDCLRCGQLGITPVQRVGQLHGVHASDQVYFMDLQEQKLMLRQEISVLEYSKKDQEIG